MIFNIFKLLGCEASAYSMTITMVLECYVMIFNIFKLLGCETSAYSMTITEKMLTRQGRFLALVSSCT
jgi:hypothetical protein